MADDTIRYEPVGGFYAGMKVLLSEYLTEASDPVQVRRSWRERLFSRPWQPWRATKMITPQVPSKNAIKLNESTLVMHPVMWRELQKEMSIYEAAYRGRNVRQ